MSPDFSDKALLDWLEKQYTLHGGVEFLYVVDGYELQHTMDDRPIGLPFHGATLRDAIKASIEESFVK